MTVQKRSIIVLGCSRGIGQGILEHFAMSDACISLVGVVRKAADAERLAARFSSDAKVTVLVGDVTDEKSMVHVAEEVRALGIVPDLLICNAGVLTPPKPFDQISSDDMLTSFTVNVMGPFNAMTAFLPLMRNVEGAVMVNVSSGWGLCGEAGEASYCTAKHAVEGLTKCAALDVANDAVSIVTVRPGVVLTDMLATACGGVEAAKQRGVPVERFAGQFCGKVLAITKAESGTHIDCGYKGPVDW